MMQDDLTELEVTRGSLSRRMEVSFSATLYLFTPVIMWDVGENSPNMLYEKV